MTTVQRVAVVTGGNKGIGFEICRQLARKKLKVVLAARDPEKGGQAAEQLQAEGLDVAFHRLDVTDAKQVKALARAMGW
jgi:NAD(P)-dependent dehydrogenase (short-subunit alcohol dehydrogenase family)